MYAPAHFALFRALCALCDVVLYDVVWSAVLWLYVEAPFIVYFLCLVGWTLFIFRRLGQIAYGSLWPPLPSPSISLIR